MHYDSLPAPFELMRLDWAEVLVNVKKEAPSTVVVFDPVPSRRGVELDPRVRELRHTAPLSPLVALLPLEDEYTQTARDLLNLGVAECADIRFERNGDALLPALLRAHAQPFKRRLEQALTINLSLNALTLLRAAAQVAVDQGNAVELSRLFAARERTVAGWCSREGLPAPRRLLAWMRILLALLLLEEPHRSILGVARDSGFASDHPLRRALRELLGGEQSVSPRERKFCDAADLLNAELRELREKAHRAKQQYLLV
jgi:AraC-like DNA-binding protein